MSHIQGPGADPSSQHTGDTSLRENLAVVCHYFLPGLWLSSRSYSTTVLTPVPNYTAWWQWHKVAACSTVVAQDHRQSRLHRVCGKGLECAATCNHVAAIAGDIQACTEDGTVPQIIRQCKLSATVALTLV